MASPSAMYSSSSAMRTSLASDSARRLSISTRADSTSRLNPSSRRPPLEGARLPSRDEAPVGALAAGLLVDCRIILVSRLSSLISLMSATFWFINAMLSFLCVSTSLASLRLNWSTVFSRYSRWRLYSRWISLSGGLSSMFWVMCLA